MQAKEFTLEDDEDYRIPHRAPMHDSGSPLYDVTGTYPDDIYGPNGVQYYGTREPWDARSIHVIKICKGKPNQTVQIFRAVPKEVKSNTINPGDWVTASKEYATQHGKGLGKYKVLTKIVPAKTLFTNGDSIHEWGYDPVGAAQPVDEGKQPGKTVVDAILKVLPVAQEVWFHGSRARGTHRKNSDTDILVVIPTDIVGDNYFAAVKALKKLSAQFDNYDIQPTKTNSNLYRIASEEGKLLWVAKQPVAEGSTQIDKKIEIFQELKQMPLIVFGSTVTKNFQDAKDFDVFLDLDQNPTYKKFVRPLLNLTGKYYGWIDAFVLKDDVLYVRNDDATAWTKAKNSLAILQQIRANGKSIDDIDLQGLAENFADGKGPGRPGDSVRHGIPKKATMAELEKAGHSAGRKGQLARWQLNMRRGKAKQHNESVAEGADDEIHNYKKLDHILATLCELVVQGQQHDPDKYGMVAACVLDPDNRVVTGINLPASTGKRRHAERVAIDQYHKEYGKIPPGSIILTTCSPCSEHMDERYGEDCTQLINSTGVKKVYCGFDDPTQPEQHREFNCMETANSQIRTLCSKFAEQFLDAESKNPVSEAVVKKSNLKTYAARVRLKQTGYTNIVDATVSARNPEMARRLLHQLYGGNSSVVGQPREIK